MIRFTALLLTVLTGFSGLVYEVTWQKYLATLLGSHSEATAAVLAIFLGGLSAGYALFGGLTRRLVATARRTRRPARLLFVYGLVEMGIGVYVALFPVLFGVAQRASLLVPADHPGLGFAFDVAVSTLLIGPPTVLMGGTIPILTLALAGDLAHATRVHAQVYGFNTLGAFAGALAAAFLLVPTLGLDGTLYAMAGVNVLAGAIFAALDPRARRAASDLADPVANVTPPSLAGYAAVALLAGFAMMTLQTTLNRVGALTFGSSPFTFAMIVAVFVLCIALGSFAVSALKRIPSGLLAGTQWALVVLLIGLYLHAEDAPYWAHRLRTAFPQDDRAFYPFQASVFGSLLALLILPIGVSGALLPLVFDRLRREMGELGSVAGRLYAWNTVGSLLGALVGGYILFFWLDLHHIYRVAVAALVAAAAILSAIVWRRSLRRLALLAVLPAWAILMALPAWSPDRITAGLFRHREATEFTFLGPDEAFRRYPRGETVFFDDDPTNTVSVTMVGGASGHGHSIVINGKSDGNVVGDFVTMAMSGLLPALMAESHERCFVIGFGTGVTTGELAALDGTRQVDVAEISHAVIEAAPIFDYGNREASRSPKVAIHRGDAYRTLLRSEETYDVIVSQPSNPWVTGVEMLFSREFLEAARSRLRPGGVYGQWFHIYEVDARSVEIALRTYASVFPHVSVWFMQSPDLLLLGFDQPDRALDLGALQSRFESPDFAAGFHRAGIDSFGELLAHELLPLDTLHAAADRGEIHTLRHPILGYRAARAFFRSEWASLPRRLDAASTAVSTRNSLLRRLGAAESGFSEDVLEAAVFETCELRRANECTALLAGWLHEHPSSDRRRQAVAKLRKLHPDISPPSDLVVQVARLFGTDGGPAVAGAAGDVSIHLATRATNQYAHFFHPALPFDPDVIRELWRSCAGPGCQEGARSAEEWLGFGPDPVTTPDAADASAGD